MSELKSLCYACMRAVSPEATVCPHCRSAIPFMERNSRLLQPGVSLKEGRYTVGRCIGTGGFGATYIALDTLLGLRVAIKEYLPLNFSSRHINSSQVIPNEGYEDNFRQFLEKFNSEAKHLRSLHLVSGVVKCTEYFMDNGTGYYVMEYLEGSTIKDYMRAQRAPYFPRDAMRIMRSLLVILEGVHEMNVLHRDVAADNLFRRSTGELVLIDFGSARSDAANHEHTSLSKGNYTPPEQRNGMKENAYTDLYAAGVLMFYLLCHREPTNKVTLEALPDTFPKPLRDIYEKATRYNPAERFQTAFEMRAAVEAWLNAQEEGQSIGQYTTQPPKSFKLVWAMLGGMFLLLGVVLALMLGNGVVSRKTFPVRVQYVTEEGALLLETEAALPRGRSILTPSADLPGLAGLQPQADARREVVIDEQGIAFPPLVQFVLSQPDQLEAAAGPAIQSEPAGAGQPAFDAAQTAPLTVTGVASATEIPPETAAAPPAAANEQALSPASQSAWVMGSSPEDLKVLQGTEWLSAGELGAEAFYASLRLRTQGAQIDRLYISRPGSGVFAPLSFWYEEADGARAFPVMLTPGEYLFFVDVLDGQLLAANDGQPVTLGPGRPNAALGFRLLQKEPGSQQLYAGRELRLLLDTGLYFVPQDTFSLEVVGNVQAVSAGLDNGSLVLRGLQPGQARVVLTDGLGQYDIPVSVIGMPISASQQRLELSPGQAGELTFLALDGQVLDHTGLELSGSAALDIALDGNRLLVSCQTPGEYSVTARYLGESTQVDIIVRSP